VWGVAAAEFSPVVIAIFIAGTRNDVCTHVAVVRHSTRQAVFPMMCELVVFHSDVQEVRMAMRHTQIIVWPTL
jgi:hypothetical protein